MWNKIQPEWKSKSNRNEINPVLTHQINQIIKKKLIIEFLKINITHYQKSNKINSKLKRDKTHFHRWRFKKWCLRANFWDKNQYCWKLKNLKINWSIKNFKNFINSNTKKAINSLEKNRNPKDRNSKEIDHNHK